MAVERYQCKGRTFDTLIDARRYALDCIGFGFTLSAIIYSLPTNDIVGRVKKQEGRFFYDSYRDDRNTYPVCKDGTLGKITKGETDDRSE